MSDDFEDDRETFHFRFQIKNFSYSTENTGVFIESPSFPVEFLDETTWQLLVYPRGKYKEGSVDIFLKRVNDDSMIKEVDLRLSLELEAADSLRVKRKEAPGSALRKNCSVGFLSFIKRKDLLGVEKSNLLPDDTLTIHCTLRKPAKRYEYIYKCTADTTHETIDSEFTWTLKNFSESESAMFFKNVKFAGESEPSFRITIFDVDESEKNLVLKMTMLKPKEEAFVTCVVAILDTEGAQALVRSTGHHFKDGTETTSYNLYNRKEIEDCYLQDGNLRLQCVLYKYIGDITRYISIPKYFNYSAYLNGYPEVVSSKVPVQEDLEDYCNKELVKDYENLYLSSTLSDVRIRADGRTVDCHKALLRARSPVFSDLLDRAEGNLVDDTIDVDDLDGDTLERLIYFLYSDKIRNIDSAIALKLFMAGHSYQIGYLIEQCLYYLKTHLNFKNVCDVLVTAHRYEDGDLKRNAIRYIGEFFDRICLTTEWHDFREAEKELASYACQCIRRMN